MLRLIIAMSQSHSWETGCRSAGKQIPSILQKPKSHSRVHNTTSLDPIFSHMNLVHTLLFYSFKINFNIILIHLRLSLASSLSLEVFLPKIVNVFHFSPTRTMCPPYLPCCYITVQTSRASLQNQGEECVRKGEAIHSFTKRASDHLQPPSRHVTEKKNTPGSPTEICSRFVLRWFFYRLHFDLYSHRTSSGLR